MPFALSRVMHARYLVSLVFLCLGSAASAASAAEGQLNAVINGKSFHLGSGYDFNENNAGLGVEYQFPTDSRWKSILMANAFRDSMDEMSYMAGGGVHRNIYTTERWSGFYVDVGINGFLMTRKDYNDNRPFPGLLPSLTIGNSFAGLNVTYLPSSAVEKMTSARILDESTRGILFVQFKMNVSALLNAD